MAFLPFTGDTASAVKTVFEKLDHSVNMFCEESWTLLHFFIYNGCKQTTESKVKETLKLCWSERESWWPEYHFRMTTNTQSHEGVNNLMLCKARIADHFMGKGLLFEDSKF